MWEIVKINKELASKVKKEFDTDLSDLITDYFELLINHENEEAKSLKKIISKKKSLDNEVDSFIKLRKMTLDNKLMEKELEVPLSVLKRIADETGYVGLKDQIKNISKNYNVNSKLLVKKLEDLNIEIKNHHAGHGVHSK